VSRLFNVAVSVGADPPAHRIVENQEAIVDTVVHHCKIETINRWLFVAFDTVNVIAVQSACPVTICILFLEQSIATV
jgi:hypothetical protein